MAANAIHTDGWLPWPHQDDANVVSPFPLPYRKVIFLGTRILSWPGLASKFIRVVFRALRLFGKQPLERKEFCMSNASFFDAARNRFRTGLAEIDRKWGWYLALGVFLIVLGVIASGMAVATTLVSVVVLGWILLVAGAGLAVLSFLTG